MRRTARIGLTVAALACTGIPTAFAADSPPAGPAGAVLSPLTPAAASGPAPTASGVGRQLASLLRGSQDLTAMVIDPQSDAVLLDSRAGTGMIPASTAKLATAAAALQVLGPDHRIATLVRMSGDTVYLVGGGDPSLRLTGKQRPGDPASIAELARAAARQLPAGAKVSVAYDDHAFHGSTLGPGWSRSFPRLGVVPPITALVADGGRATPGGNSRVADPAQAAAEAFGRELGRHGVVVQSVSRGRAPADAPEIARVESQPVARLVETMLTDSENAYAESLAHLVGGVSLGKPTFAGGAEATSTLPACPCRTAAGCRAMTASRHPPCPASSTWLPTALSPCSPPSARAFRSRASPGHSRTASLPRPRARRAATSSRRQER